MVPLVLASQSPRRRQLLAAAGYEFIVSAPDDEVERAVAPGLPPEKLVVVSARAKAEAIAQALKTGVVIAADTVAECKGQILGKPESRADAKRMLELMSGQRHRVLTGVCLWRRPDDRIATFLETTELEMEVLKPEALDRYLDSKDWQGKAGAFGYQDGLDWVHIIEGLESTVVGFPVERLKEWLEQLNSQE